MKKGILYTLFFTLVVSVCIIACKKEETPAIVTTTPPPPVKYTVAEIQTNSGNTILWLYDKTPLHKNNFLKLIRQGFYDNLLFHRVVKNFVIQGGDPLGDGTGNYIESGNPRFIKLEVDPNLKFDRPGRVGMARTSDPNSASCQFFIALQSLPSLNPGGVDPYGYAVFGQVTEDTFETVKAIVKDSKPAFPGSDKPANPVKMYTITLQ